MLTNENVFYMMCKNECHYYAELNLNLKYMKIKNCIFFEIRIVFICSLIRTPTLAYIDKQRL